MLILSRYLKIQVRFILLVYIFNILLRDVNNFKPFQNFDNVYQLLFYHHIPFLMYVFSIPYKATSLTFCWITAPSWKSLVLVCISNLPLKPAQSNKVLRATIQLINSKYSYSMSLN